MYFKQWFLNLINEDFKTQRIKYINQGIDAAIVDRYLAIFDDIRNKKYKEVFAKIYGVNIPQSQRTSIDAYNDFHELERVVDYVKGQKDLTGAKFTDIKFSGKPIYNENGLEIYYADSPRACIEYKGSIPYSWCISRKDASNMFYTYRFKPHEPAFYFVKDLEKTRAEFGLWNATKLAFSGKWKDPYHFFVIQTLKNADVTDRKRKQYLVTSAQNDGDRQMSWDEIVAIEPKLNNLQNILATKPLTDIEKTDYSRFKDGLNNEQFSKLDYKEKNRYLDIYVKIDRLLTDEQFEMLPDDLKNKYISFGVGLLPKQYELIKNNSQLIKRYAQITLRKLEEIVKNNASLYLVLSEVDVLKSLPNEVEKIFESLDEDQLFRLSHFRKYYIIRLMSDRQKERLLQTAINKDELLLGLFNYNIPDNLILKAIKSGLKLNDEQYEFIEKNNPEMKHAYIVVRGADIEQEILSGESLKEHEYKVTMLLPNVDKFIGNVHGNHNIYTLFAVLNQEQKDRVAQLIIHKQKDTLDTSILIFLLLEANNYESLLKQIGEDKLDNLGGSDGSEYINNDNFLKAVKLFNRLENMWGVFDRKIIIREISPNKIVEGVLYLINNKKLDDDDILQLINVLDEVLLNTGNSGSFNSIYAKTNSAKADIVNIIKSQRGGRLSHEFVHNLIYYSDNSEEVRKAIGPENLAQIPEKEMKKLISDIEDKDSP